MAGSPDMRAIATAMKAKRNVERVIEQLNSALQKAGAEHAVLEVEEIKDAQQAAGELLERQLTADAPSISAVLLRGPTEEDLLQRVNDLRKAMQTETHLPEEQQEQRPPLLANLLGPLICHGSVIVSANESEAAEAQHAHALKYGTSSSSGVNGSFASWGRGEQAGPPMREWELQDLQADDSDGDGDEIRERRARVAAERGRQDMSLPIEGTAVQLPRLTAMTHDQDWEVMRGLAPAAPSRYAAQRPGLHSSRQWQRSGTAHQNRVEARANRIEKIRENCDAQIDADRTAKTEAPVNEADSEMQPDAKEAGQEISQLDSVNRLSSAEGSRKRLRSSRAARSSSPAAITEPTRPVVHTSKVASNSGHQLELTLAKHVHPKPAVSPPLSVPMSRQLPPRQGELREETGTRSQASLLPNQDQEQPAESSTTTSVRSSTDKPKIRILGHRQMQMLAEKARSLASSSDSIATEAEEPAEQSSASGAADLLASTGVAPSSHTLKLKRKAAAPDVESADLETNVPRPRKKRRSSRTNYDLPNGAVQAGAESS